jgi:hypothetical protein
MPLTIIHQNMVGINIYNYHKDRGVILGIHPKSDLERSKIQYCLESREQCLVLEIRDYLANHSISSE